MDTEPPKPSPRPPAPPLDEPKTDPAIRIVKKSMRKELNWQGAKLTIATAVIAVGTAFGAYRVVLSEAAAQTDAGVRVHEQRISTLEQQRKSDRNEYNERFERMDRSQARTEKKLDALLDRLDVRNPAPTPKDAGQ